MESNVRFRIRLWLVILSVSLHVCVSRSITEWPVSLLRLQASNCDDKTCPAPAYRDEYIVYCGYECPLFHMFICEEDEHMNVIEYCLPVDLICEPGYYVRGKIDHTDETKVILELLQCPEGTYKQFTNHCIDQCSIQESEDFLPDMFIPYERGNYKEPAKVVCDHHKNYFTKTDKLWYYQDQNFTHLYKHYCEHVPDNPCPSGKRPSKDGSCLCGIVECLSENNTFSGSTSMSSEEQPRSTTSMTTPGMSNQNTDQTLVFIVVFGIVLPVVIGIIIIALLVYIIFKRRNIEKEKKKEVKEEKVTHSTKNIYGDYNKINQQVIYLQSRPSATYCTYSEGENEKNNENDSNNNEESSQRLLDPMGTVVTMNDDSDHSN